MHWLHALPCATAAVFMYLTNETRDGVAIKVIYQALIFHMEVNFTPYITPFQFISL